MTSDVLARINRAAQILQTNPWTKDMSNSQFKSVDIDQIRREVGAAEAEAGLVVQYTELEFDVIGMNGKMFSKIKADLTYYSIEDTDFEHGLTFHRSAIGYDTLDKGYNKAESMLYKNHYKGLYHIGERADDPDQYSEEEYSLLEAFRYAAGIVRDDPTFYNEFSGLIQTLAPRIEEAKRAEKLAKRQAAASSDAFFSKAAKPAEKPESKPADIAPPGPSFEAMREVVLAYAHDRPEDPLLVEMEGKYGPVAGWRLGVYKHCWQELPVEVRMATRGYNGQRCRQDAPEGAQ